MFFLYLIELKSYLSLHLLGINTLKRVRRFLNGRVGSNWLYSSNSSGSVSFIEKQGGLSVLSGVSLLLVTPNISGASLSDGLWSTQWV